MTFNKLQNVLVDWDICDRLTLPLDDPLTGAA